MSTVLLMTDTWQPTVLRLVPFSSNNAKEVPRKANVGQRRVAHNHVRNFPVLAVTRSVSKIGTNVERTYSARTNISESVADNISDGSCMTPVSSAHSGRSQITQDDVDGHSVVTNKRHRKYAKKKIPETRSEMKEAIKFSVQDINDQVSSSSSLHSGEFAVDSSAKEKHSKADNTRTRLPKPSICQQHDPKTYAPINGVRRSVPLTPGEIELQKFREAYNQEQSLKRKKYKLNVNQLPRSTTPINDHDPDKLNMKQVIAFLQTKASKDLQKKVIGSRHPASPGRVCRSQTFYRPLHSPKRSHTSASGGINGSSAMEDKLDNTRLDNPGCVSVLSTKSTPNLSFGSQPSKNNKTSTTRSIKSFKGDSSSRSSTLKEKKPVKEFKLYRFLAAAPESDRGNQSLGTAVTEVNRKDGTNDDNYSALPPGSPKRLLRRRHRDSTTANLIHRRAASKNGGSSSNGNVYKTKESEDFPKSIRLPSMNDEDIDDDDDTAESCSTTSATCNSTKNSSNKEDRSKLPKKGKSITFSEERADVDSESHTIIDGDLNNNSSIQTVLNGYLTMAKQPYKFSDLNNVGLSFEPPRQIHVNMPTETKSFSQEIVRLTLKNDKNSTRVTSYMSDLQSKTRSSSGAWSNMNNGEDIDHVTLEEKKEWYESPKELINTVSKNNFVRIRQKTKLSSDTSA